jgi:hypothetical protein
LIASENQREIPAEYEKWEEEELPLNSSSIIKSELDSTMWKL